MTSKIGPYVIERRLGLGGMAEVFLARKQLGSAYKRVVVKRMLPELSDDPKFVDMFEREAGILAQLNHANIVQIFDLGTSDGKLYIAMEWLDGISLHDLAVRAWRARRPLPMELVLRVIAEAARGLDYVHRQKDGAGQPLRLVHRDVAPDNLFFVNDGTVKLLDFGVARGATMKELTRRGEVKGKVPFMSPESLESLPLDGRSDLFSLGVSAYWLLTGRRPFRADNDLGLIRAILRTDPTPLVELNVDVPARLAAAVHKLLEKDPAARIQSGAELEGVIMRNAGQQLDRARDVAYVEELLTLSKKDLDDATNPIPAVRRTPSGVFARAPSPSPRPISIVEAEPVSDDMVEGEADLEFEVAPTVQDGEITAPAKPTMPAASPRSPLPRAMGVDLDDSDVDDPSNETLRLTESQLGLKR